MVVTQCLYLEDFFKVQKNLLSKATLVMAIMPQRSETLFTTSANGQTLMSLMRYTLNTRPTVRNQYI